MRALAAVIFALALSACSTTNYSSAHYYRAPGATEQVTIAGQVLKERAFVGYNFTVTVTANGYPICHGSAPGRLTGEFNGKQTECECMPISGDRRCYFVGTSGSCVQDQNVRCFVFIGGDRAADLAL